MRILQVMPRYSAQGHFEAIESFYHSLGEGSPNKICRYSPQVPLLATCFNDAWAKALDEFEKGNINGVAYQHSDVVPPVGWLDILYRQKCEIGCDLISAVISIKDDRGLSSTAVDDTGDEWLPRRLTMQEVLKLPETFTDEHVGGRLLLNTGLFLCSLGEWATTPTDVFFKVTDCIRKEGGKRIARCKPEDWDFSRQCRERGLKLAATRAVKVNHHGDTPYPNDIAWGWDQDWQNGPNAEWRIGWRFPADVPGWLTFPEAAKLVELARGKRVVEIGSYHGKSTVAMAQVAELVRSIDWHEGDAGSGPGGTLPFLKATLERYGVVEKVTLHVGRTEVMAPRLPAKAFDLVFIDGAHDEANVRIDIAAALRLVKPGGTIAFHDWPMPSVQGPAKEFLGPHVDGTVDSLAWYEREIAA
jgi:SAM-dependent methyltransferase